MKPQFYSFAWWSVSADIGSMKAEQFELRRLRGCRRSNMKWRREIDYHGSREYGSEEGSERRFRLGLAGVAAFVKRAFGKLGREPGPPMVLLHDGQHSFSLLGVDSRAAARGKAAECPFPIKAEPADYRSYRVFP
jgi:hypothetical protein